MSATTAPDPNLHVILGVTGFNNSTWTAVTVPATMGTYGCRSFSVTNSDASSAMLVCTDGTGTSVISVAALGNYSARLWDFGKRGWASGEIVCYVKGAGTGAVGAFVR